MFYGFEIRQAPLQIKLNDFPKKLQPIVTKMPQHGHPSFRRGNCDKVSVSTKSEPRSDSRASENSTTKRCCLSLICLSSSNDQPCEHTPDLMQKSLSFCSFSFFSFLALKILMHELDSNLVHSNFMTPLGAVLKNSSHPLSVESCSLGQN